jgi:uncharacterized protein involved in exopolysaccharide biosynthesis
LSENQHERAESTVPAVDVGRYLRAIKRWALLIVAAGLVGAAAGAVLLPSKSYTSTAVVQVHDGIVSLANPAGLNQPPNMSTEQQVATGYDTLLLAANADTDHPDVSAFQRNGKVTVPLNSTALVFKYTADSPKAAQNGALAWANAYLTQRTSGLQSKLDKQTRVAKANSNAIAREVKDLERQLSGLNVDTLAYTTVQGRLNGKKSELKSAQKSINNLAQADIDAGQLIGNPQRPSHPNGISPLVGLLLGGATGLFIGIVLALIAERFSKKIRDGHDLARATNVGVWGVLAPDSPGAKLEIEAIGARLALLARRHQVRSLLITGLTTPYPDLAAQLSSAIDRLGVKVKVTDDIERLLTGSEDNPDEKEHEFLVVDGPPVLVDPRTAVFSSEANVTLVVVRHRSSTVDEVGEAVQRIAAAGGAVTGVVMIIRAHRRFLRGFKLKPGQRTQQQPLTATSLSDPAAPMTPMAPMTSQAPTAPAGQEGHNGVESPYWNAEEERLKQIHGSVPVKKKGSSSPARERRPRG